MTEIDVCKTIKAKAFQWWKHGDHPLVRDEDCEDGCGYIYVEDASGYDTLEVDPGCWVITGDDGVDVLTDAEFREQWTEGKG